MRMKHLGFALATVVAVAAQPSSAAVRLVSATVSGASGTVWDTIGGNSFYNFFIQNPFGNVLNPTDQTLSPFALTTGVNNFLGAGDGFPTGAATRPAVNSDLQYTLTLQLDNGMGGALKELSGTYDTTTGIFVPTTGPANFFGRNYTLNDFTYNRGLSNLVGAYTVASSTSPIGPGSRQDYASDFNISSVAIVPEASTWAMMIVGMGMVGGVLRRRAKSLKFAAA